MTPVNVNGEKKTRGNGEEQNVTRDNHETRWRWPYKDNVQRRSGQVDGGIATPGGAAALRRRNCAPTPLKTVVDCVSSGQILHGKLREYYLVPGVIKLNSLKINLLTNKSKVSVTTRGDNKVRSPMLQLRRITR